MTFFEKLTDCRRNVAISDKFLENNKFNEFVDSNDKRIHALECDLQLSKSDIKDWYNELLEHQKEIFHDLHRHELYLIFFGDITLFALLLIIFLACGVIPF